MKRFYVPLQNQGDLSHAYHVYLELGLGRVVLGHYCHYPGMVVSPAHNPHMVASLAHNLNLVVITPRNPQMQT